MLLKSESVKEEEYRQYGYRHVIMAIFCTLSFISGMCWVTVSPISVPVGRAYDQSDAVVAIIPMCYMIVYVIVNFPSNWVLDVQGIKKGMVVGAVLTALGAAIRCLITTHFAFVIVGQILCAIAQPFILNAPTKIAVRWFLPKSRPIALAILSVSNIVGTAVGFIMPPLFVENDALDDKIRAEFTGLLITEFVFSLLPLILVILWFREKPLTPANPSSELENMGYLTGIKVLFRDRRFLGLLFSFGTIMGSFCVFGSILDNILDCYGFTSDEVSYLAAGMMITGIVSAGVFGLYIQKTLKYTRIFRLLAVLGLVQCVGFPIVVGAMKHNFGLTLVLSIVQGIVFIPFMPLSFDYGCDILFPAGEAQITGCLMAAGNLIGIIFIVIAQQGFGLGERGNSDEENQSASLKTLIVVGAVTALGVVLYCFYNSELKRSKLDKERQNKSLLENE